LVYNLAVDLDQLRVIKLGREQRPLLSDSISIGGVPFNSNTTTSYYSDNIELTEFELNHERIFDEAHLARAAHKSLNKNTVSCNITSLFTGKLESAGSEVYLKMKRNYAEFIKAETFKCSQQEIVTCFFFSTGFNLTIDFKFAFYDTQLVTELVLIESSTAVLQLNLRKSRFELIVANQVTSWVRAEFSRAIQINRLTVLVNLDSVALELNDLRQTYSIGRDVNLAHLGLFTDKFVQINLNSENSFEFKRIFLNRNRIEDFYRPVFSSAPVSDLCSSLRKAAENRVALTTPSTHKNDKNAFASSTASTADAEPSADLSNKELFFYNVAVVALIVSVVSLVIFVAVLVIVYVREQRRNLKNRSQFNSKNRLELSLNNSCSLPNTSSIPSESSPSKNSGDSVSMVKTGNTMCSAAANNLVMRHHDPTEFVLSCASFVTVSQKHAIEDGDSMAVTVAAENYVEIGDSSSGLSCEQLKEMLVWTPSFNEYENLFYEFASFKSQAVDNARSSSLPIYDAEKQTYV
jgi:hypothetical protein